MTGIRDDRPAPTPGPKSGRSRLLLAGRLSSLDDQVLELRGVGMVLVVVGAGEAVERPVDTSTRTGTAAVVGVASSSPSSSSSSLSKSLSSGTETLLGEEAAGVELLEDSVVEDEDGADTVEVSAEAGDDDGVLRVTYEGSPEVLDVPKAAASSSCNWFEASATSRLGVGVSGGTSSTRLPVTRGELFTWGREGRGFSVEDQESLGV